MQSTKKAKEIVKSRNAMVTVIGIAFSLLATAGVYVAHTPEEMFDIVSSEGGITAIIVVLTYILNLAAKVVDKKINWSILKDRNVIAGLVTIVSIVLGSALNEEGAAAIATLIVNSWNFVAHAQEPPKSIEENANNAN